MQKTIKAKWSEITGNRKELDETIIGKGIEEQSLVNSDELNSIVNRQDEMLDDLQRGNAWNIGKEYNQGDMIFVNVNYKRLSDTSGKTYKCFVICKNNATTAEPFINNANKAIAFSKNYDYAVTQFIIQVDDDSTPLTHFINSDFWDFVTINDDLSNATKLNVSNEAKLGTQGKDSSIITFDRDIILNSNLDTKGTFDIKGNLTGGSLNSNNNIAWGNAFVKTPAYNAKGDEIVNAEWFNIRNKYLEYNNNDSINPIVIVEQDPIGFSELPKTYYGNITTINQQAYHPVIIYVYKIFPQDFPIESFSSALFILSAYQGIDASSLSFVTWNNYLSIYGMNIQNTPENQNLFEPHRFRYTYFNLYDIPFVDELFNNSNFIPLDFSKDFEIQVDDLITENRITSFISITQISRMGWVTSYQKIGNYIDPFYIFNKYGEKEYGNSYAIKWNKQTRMLCFCTHYMWYNYQVFGTYVSPIFTAILRLKT